MTSVGKVAKHVQKFKSYYSGFIVVLIGFLFYIYFLTILANLGYGFNMGMILNPALSVLFFYIGFLLSHTKRNWFIGIRTPWTLENDKIWEKTHKLGAKLFKISSLLILVGIVFPDYTFWVVMGSALLAGLTPVIYSYFLYQKEKKKWELTIPQIT